MEGYGDVRSNNQKFGGPDSRGPPQDGQNQYQTKLTLCPERDNWEKSPDVMLDTYNCDLNIIINEAGDAAKIYNNGGFSLMWGGVRANFGVKNANVFYEVHVLRNLPVETNEDAVGGTDNVIRVGWSADSTSFVLGEEEFSYGYGGTGKKSNQRFESYGTKFSEGDIVTAYLEYESNEAVISYSVNGVHQGVCFTVKNLNGRALFPHVYLKNVEFKVNFGNSGDAAFPLDAPKKSSGEWEFIGHLANNQLTRGKLPPGLKSKCEAIMMVGLPGAGKTYLADKIMRENPDKQYYVLGTNLILEKMKVTGLSRKRNYHGRWDVLIEKATKCLNTLISVASSRRRNYILDQTNVYPSAQRRKMRPFEGFKRKAIVVVPTDEVFRQRIIKREKEEGKEVPESAINEMKANFSIPLTRAADHTSPFDIVEFSELQYEEAKNLVSQYVEEAAKSRSSPEHKRSNWEDNRGGGYDRNRDNSRFNKYNDDDKPSFGRGGYQRDGSMDGRGGRGGRGGGRMPFHSNGGGGRGGNSAGPPMHRGRGGGGSGGPPMRQPMRGRGGYENSGPPRGPYNGPPGQQPHHQGQRMMMRGGGGGGSDRGHRGGSGFQRPPRGPPPHGQYGSGGGGGGYRPQGGPPRMRGGQGGIPPSGHIGGMSSGRPPYNNGSAPPMAGGYDYESQQSTGGGSGKRPYPGGGGHGDGGYGEMDAQGGAGGDMGQGYHSQQSRQHSGPPDHYQQQQQHQGYGAGGGGGGYDASGPMDKRPRMGAPPQSSGGYDDYYGSGGMEAQQGSGGGRQYSRFDKQPAPDMKPQRGGMHGGPPPPTGQPRYDMRPPSHQQPHQQHPSHYQQQQPPSQQPPHASHAPPSRGGHQDPSQSAAMSYGGGYGAPGQAAYGAGGMQSAAAPTPQAASMYGSGMGQEAPSAAQTDPAAMAVAAYASYYASVGVPGAQAGKAAAGTSNTSTGLEAAVNAAQQFNASWHQKQNPPTQSAGKQPPAQQQQQPLSASYGQAQATKTPGSAAYYSSGGR